MRMIIVRCFYLFYQWLSRCKYPVMLRKHRDQEINDLRKFYCQAKIQDDQKLDKDRELLRELIGKLTNLKFEVTGKGNFYGHRYRVCVDIDTKLVDQCFVHGGDQYAIDFLCRELGYQVGVEMQTINFKRLAMDANKEHDRNRQ